MTMASGLSDTNDEIPIVDLKHMVMSFRVSELQMLLGTAGRNKSGRKHDLMSRALQLLKNGCSTVIQRKIQDLHHGRHPRHKYSQKSTYNDDKNSPDFETYPDKIKQSSVKAHHPAVHPNVTFKPLPFFEVLSDVLKPSSLFSRPSRGHTEADFNFTLTEQQVQLIQSSMSRENNRKFNSAYQVQVQMRFCLLETTCEQSDLLPPNLCVKVNHKLVTLPNYIPPSKAGVEPKRASRSIDITSMCRLCHVSYSHVAISWLAAYGRNYATSINVVRQLTSDMLLQRLRRKGVRNADHSRALIKEKLTRDPESEIATTSLKVSLLCPLGKMRMKIPARPITCTHMQCFDGDLFLQMNERKPTWICPVCDKPADFANLFIDGLFMEILEKTDLEEIVFLEDGDWQPVKSAKETLSLCTPSKAIALDLSSSPNSSPSKDKSKSKGPEIIDLTGDTSDEEEDEPPRSIRNYDNNSQETEDIHSLSSTSPYRSESRDLSSTEGKRTPLKRPHQSTWDSIQEGHPINGNKSAYYPSESSPCTAGFTVDAIDHSAITGLGRTSNYLPGSRDNTPPLHPFLSAAGMSGLQNGMDYSSFDPFNIYPMAAFESMRRMAADHSARSSPYLLNQTANSLYQPGSENLARSYLNAYPPSYNPYSPLQFLPAQDSSSSPPDIIPID